MNSALVASEFCELSANYFNSAYFGPLPKSAQQQGQKVLEFSTNPTNFPYESWRPLPDKLRQQISRLLDVSAEQIAHHSSVSELISYVSLGFPFKAGEKVVVMQGDYPSDVLPWLLNQKRMQYEVTKLAEECFVNPQKLIEELPRDTRILNLSHVMFNTGRKNDIAQIGQICRERDILFVVDVSQSLGGMELHHEEIKNCDILVGATYKWLLGPYGHAFSYWSDNALNKIENVHLSWQSSRSATGAGNLLNYDINPIGGARRFDRGQAPNVLGLNMLSASLNLFETIRLANIEQHNKKLVNHFLEHYPREKYQLKSSLEQPSNILCLQQISGDSVQLENQLRQHGIESSVREGNLRLSFHLFNTIEEVNYLIKCL